MRVPVKRIMAEQTYPAMPMLIMPMMMFIGNINYVLVAVVGGLRVASGNMSVGDVQAFVQYSRQSRSR